jgi:hypothetical protein
LVYNYVFYQKIVKSVLCTLSSLLWALSVSANCSYLCINFILQLNLGYGFSIFVSLSNHVLFILDPLKLLSTISHQLMLIFILHCYYGLFL